MTTDSRTSVHLDVSPGAAAHVLDPDEPFRILVLGDFSGRASQNRRESLAGRKPVLIDRDNIEEVLAWMKVTLEVAGAQIGFEELDDFHPDRLYDRIPAFRSLSEQKKSQIAPPAAPRQMEARASGGGLLDSMLDEEAPLPPRDPAAGGDLADFLRAVTAPYLEKRVDPRQKALEARLDSEAAVSMRALLHYPAFQALEAAWLGLDFLVRRLDTDENLKVYVVDATLEELIGDPAGCAKILQSESRWALITALYTFGQSAAEAKALSMLGKLAMSAGAPLVAEGLPPGAESSREWQDLRRSPEAKWIGLAVPRFLLRLPYGSGTSPIERFDFDELPDRDHNGYLWGSPALACACLLGQSFSASGWEMRPGQTRRLDSIPLHVYREDGESKTKPCAEILMSEKDAEYLGENGFMALASLKDQDAVLLVRFQSIGEPLAALAGRWKG